MANNLLWTDKDPETGKTYHEIWKEGCQAGYDDAINNKPYPKDFVHRGGVYWRGYAEGRLSASSKTKTDEHNS